MRIVASACDFPAGLPEQENIELNSGFRCVRNKDKSNRFIADWAYQVCKRMLDANKITPEEIGLIISISISPDNLVQHQSVAAPRLCHPLQRALGANRAFVFDLLDSDWATAIQVAKGFALSQDYKYALIVRAEKMHTSILHDEENGFDVPDGVGVLLLSPQEASHKPVSYTYVADSEHASLHFLERHDMLRTGYKARFEWPFKENTSTELNRTGREIIDQHTEHGHYPDFIVAESWFPKHHESLSDVSDKVISQSAEQQALGPFTIPYFIREINRLQEAGNSPKTVLALSFNPFLMRYSAVSLSI